MNILWAISWISFKEGLRQRILYGVMLFSLLIMAFSVLLSGLFMRDISKIILDFCLASISIGGLLIPFFIAIDLLAKDIERRTIFSILAKPVARWQYIVGKFIGLIMLTGLIMAILTLVCFLSAWSGKLLYGAHFFRTFSPLSILVAVLAAYLGIAVFTALVILWCSLTTSSFLATLLTLFTYIIGHTIDDVVRFLSVDTPGVEISSGIKYAVKTAQYIFPNLAAFDFKLQAAHGMLPAATDVFLILFYAVAYISATLALATIVFSRRDLS